MLKTYLTQIYRTNYLDNTTFFIFKTDRHCYRKNIESRKPTIPQIPIVKILVKWITISIKFLSKRWGLTSVLFCYMMLSTTCGSLLRNSTGDFSFQFLCFIKRKQLPNPYRLSLLSDPLILKYFPICQKLNH